MSYEEYKEEGFAGPFPLLNNRKTKQLIEKFSNRSERTLPWLKGRHTTSKIIAEVACHHMIVDKIKKILGNDIILSGSQIIKQVPGRKLCWHVDMEHTQWKGVSVWVALENVIPKQSISLISRSQHFDYAPEDFRLNGVDITRNEEVNSVARRIDPDASLVDLNIKDGEFFIFEGKVWHATQNLTHSPRYALLLQYCRPDQKVKATLDIKYPHIKFHTFRPECLLVSGSDNYQVNRVITRKQVGTPLRRLKAAIWYAPRTLVYKALRGFGRGL